MMAYLRSTLKEEFFEKKNGTSSKSVLISEAMNLDFEMYCLEFYLAILTYLYVYNTRTTSLEADMELLDPVRTPTKLNWNQRMAVVYRSERKKILRDQIELVSWVQSLVKQIIIIKKHDISIEN